MHNLGLALANPKTIILSDINGDNQPDILIRDSRELVLAQNTNGKFGIQSMSWPNLGDSGILAIANIDRTNTSMEIITMDANSGTLGTISHNGVSWQSFQSKPCL